MLLLFKFPSYIQVHCRLDLFMAASNMNSDQTAPKGAVRSGPYCLQYRLPKNFSRQEEQTSQDRLAMVDVRFDHSMFYRQIICMWRL